jgi:hypothetical protein
MTLEENIPFRLGRKDLKTIRGKWENKEIRLGSQQMIVKMYGVVSKQSKFVGRNNPCKGVPPKYLVK